MAKRLSAAHRAKISASLRRGGAGRRNSVTPGAIRGRAKAMARAKIAVRTVKSGRLRQAMRRTKARGY
jgi:hypothetical protein